MFARFGRGFFWYLVWYLLARLCARLGILETILGVYWRRFGL
jgi:hypothetical protein